MSTFGLGSLLDELDNDEEEYYASLRKEQVRCPNTNDHAHELYHGDPRGEKATLILHAKAAGSRSSAMSALLPLTKENIVGLKLGEVKKIGGDNITDKDGAVLDLHLKRVNVDPLEEGEDYENKAFLPLKNVIAAGRAEGKTRGGSPDVSVALYEENQDGSELLVVVGVSPPLASKLAGRSTDFLTNMLANEHRSIITHNGNALKARLSQQSDGKSRVVLPSKLPFPERYLPPHLFKGKYSNSQLVAEHKKWKGIDKKETDSSVSKKRKRRR